MKLLREIIELNIKITKEVEELREFIKNMDIEEDLKDSLLNYPIYSTDRLAPTIYSICNMNENKETKKIKKAAAAVRKNVKNYFMEFLQNNFSNDEVEKILKGDDYYWDSGRYLYEKINCVDLEKIQEKLMYLGNELLKERCINVRDINDRQVSTNNCYTNYNNDIEIHLRALKGFYKIFTRINKKDNSNYGYYLLNVILSKKSPLNSNDNLYKFLLENKNNGKYLDMIINNFLNISGYFREYRQESIHFKKNNDYYYGCLKDTMNFNGVTLIYNHKKALKNYLLEIEANLITQIKISINKTRLEYNRIKFLNLFFKTSKEQKKLYSYYKRIGFNIEPKEITNEELSLIVFKLKNRLNKKLRVNKRWNTYLKLYSDMIEYKHVISASNNMIYYALKAPKKMKLRNTEYKLLKALDAENNLNKRSIGVI